MTPNVPIAAWLPDHDLTIPGVLSDVENLGPTQRGYAPEYTLEDALYYSGTLAAEPFGSAAVRLANGIVAPLVGTRAGLYHLTTGGIVDRSRASPYVAPTQQYAVWHFAAFDTTTLAINYDNTLQATASIGSTDFADVSGGPKAFTLAVQRNFVIVGNIKDGAYAGGNSWLCSAIEDHTDWTPDIATQSATGRLTATPGDIVRMYAYRDNVIAFKAGGFHRGTYVGAARNTWEWPVVSSNVGLVGPEAICEAEGVLYWLAEDGFYRWVGGAVERIRSAPWEWLIDRSGAGILQSIQATYDPVRRVVRFIVSLPGDAFARTVLSYHAQTDRWGKARMAAYCGVPLWSEAVPTVTQPSDVLRTLPLGYIGYDLKPKLQTGMPGESSFTTGDVGDDDTAFDLNRARVRYRTAPESSIAQHSTRMNLGDALVVRSEAARVDGKYDLAHSARWHRVRFTQTGRYEVQGYSVETPKAGKR